jgi:lipid-binding SYLF domain-containing protein
MTEAITTMEGAIRGAEQTLEHLFNPSVDTDKRIPIDLIHEAKGLAFLTVIKAGFIWTGKVGTGIVISKLPDGRWSAPSAIGTMGMGFGAEAGGQLIEFLIVLNSDTAVKSFMQRGQLSAGANLEFAAGPYGRAAGANANFSASGIAPNYTYSHSKGLFGGVGLQGSAIAARADINKKFYGRDITPTEILTGAVEQPAAASQLYDAIDRILTVPPSGNASFLKNKFLSPFLDRMPAAAVGPDIQVVYDRVLGLIEGFAGPAGVEEFKANCKDYGQNRMADEQFAGYLTDKFGAEQVVTLIPEIIKLLQDQEKRKYLWVRARVGSYLSLLVRSLTDVSDVCRTSTSSSRRTRAARAARRARARTASPRRRSSSSCASVVGVLI